MNSFASIDEALPYIKRELDAGDVANKKVLVLYACNASGKTRLSKLFNEQHKGGNPYSEQVLYYNAFTEDLFSWDNNDYALQVDSNSRIFKTIEDEGLENRIIDNFQKFTGSKIEPAFDFVYSEPDGQVIFGIYKGDDSNVENIKISRGEESVFVWSVFYTILNAVIEELSDASEGDGSETNFDNIKYIVIDDPVSSMDDTRIITIALELAELITKSESKLKFLITTHHALFFNILFNAGKNSKWNRKTYILSKSDEKIHLIPQEKDSPFAYHHVIISDIERAIKENEIKKYHFNLFRALLEKTANFLGYSEGWRNLLPEEKHGKAIIKVLDHYSHNSLSDLESKDLSENNKKDFKEAFHYFIREFKWGMKNDG